LSLRRKISSPFSQLKKNKKGKLYKEKKTTQSGDIIGTKGSSPSVFEKQNSTYFKST
jgi:hypothetical protein